ncbi:MAG: hypothetical protein GY757_33510 [bacterium]|nr:hypothetical protein [bacterium]
MNRFTPETSTFTHYRNIPHDPNSLSNNKVQAICEDSTGTLWVGTRGGGINKFLPETETFIRYLNDPDDPKTLSHNEVRAIYKESNGSFWVGTFAGLNRFEQKKGTFTRFFAEPNNPNSISDNLIMSIYEDRSGILWIGSAFGGLDKLDKNQQLFKHYHNIPNDPTSLSAGRLGAICQDHNGVTWIGTYSGGLDKFDRENNTFTHFRNDPDNPSSLSDDCVRSIYEDKQKVLWVGTKGGLNRFDPEKNEFYRYKSVLNKPNSLSNDRVFAICEDREGNLWVGTLKGLNRFDRKKETFKHYYHDHKTPGGISNNLILAIIEDSYDVLWLGTDEGLNHYHPGKDTFSYYMSDLSDPHSISNDKIRSFCEDTGRTLWIGTMGGLNRYNRKSDTFAHYTVENGLPNDVINGILEDEHENLWLSTNRGLSKFNPKTGVFKNYSYGGVQGNQFNSDACCKSITGELIFGGSNGFNIFFPDTLRDDPNPPVTVFTDLRIFDKSVRAGEKVEGRQVLEKHISVSNDIRLSYKHTTFTIEYAALHYAAPDRNRYAYKMEGLDFDWNQVGNRRFATYTHIPPGQYVFRIKSANSDGVWDNTGTAIKIMISPPFWKTWWAYVFYVLLLLTSIIAAHRIRVHQLKKHKKELEKEVVLRTEELAAAIESLRKANTDILVINENLQQSMEELSRANEELKKANQMKNEFLGIAAHDLKNPLQVIKGFTYLLQMKLKKKKLSFSELQAINTSVDKMVYLISELMDTASIESGKMKLNKTWLSLSSLTNSVILGNLNLAAKKSQDIVYYHDSKDEEKCEQCMVYADKMALRQVIENLVSNAIKYSPLGKPIHVSVENTGETLSLKIKDEGPGLTDEDKKNLFKQFRRLSAKPTGGESSTGLGLSICKKFVEMHDGTVYVESEIGKGSTFIVQLPWKKNPHREEK